MNVKLKDLSLETLHRGYLLSRKKRNEVRQPLTNSIPCPYFSSNSAVSLILGITVDPIKIFLSRFPLVTGFKRVHLFAQVCSLRGHNLFHISNMHRCSGNHIEILNKHRQVGTT